MIATSHDAWAANTNVASNKGTTTRKGDHCLDINGLEALQGLRYRNYLMVVGLTCQGLYPQASYYSQYLRFSDNNSAMFDEYLKTIVQQWPVMGKNFTAEGLKNLETEIANNVSKVAAVNSSFAFCTANKNKIAEAVALNTKQLRAGFVKGAEKDKKQIIPCR
ncbi:MAG: hypothetical protein ACOYK8_00725 [Alphaproteobacteria bacterium]